MTDVTVTTPYARLRAAVLAYAAALNRYGALASTGWVEQSEELDELWNAVLDACEAES